MRSIFTAFLLVLTTAHAASIWHVTGDQEYYLFGTIHVMKPESYPLPKVYEEAFSQCDQLWLEIDQKEMEDTALLLEAQKMMLLPAGEILDQQVSENSLNQMKELAEIAGINLGLFQGLKPWAAVNVLTLTVMQMQGFDVERGLDEHLAGWAERDGIPTQGFESLLWQMRMLDNLGTTYTEEFIEFSTNEMDNVEQLVEQLVSYWQQGDVESLYQQAAFENYREIEQAMLTDRNNNWMGILTNSPQQNSTVCVAVGALHMAGEFGLIEQFKQKGFQVKRLN
ncbi:TraB/GumN family protein [Reinekea marina]|uniref:TraB/GumN family protein n=1 Tax=Reinekea marina TaxID=1310421 RepID=A0ABV7WNQ2_9GAMM|nr:TraB/GumN family protein [Reinekea marina]MDN3647807.1 TraB/GumN family protein [Reinekea marina]